MNEIPFRSKSEISGSFSLAASQLDSILERIRSSKQMDGVAVKDCSNRSGFDHSGFPYFLWSYRLSRSFDHGSSCAMSSLYIDYFEPIKIDETPKVTIRRQSELFTQCQPSFFNIKNESALNYDEFLSMDHIKFVSDQMNECINIILDQPRA